MRQKKSTGYKDGPVIVDNQLTYTSGGGLCQVSTTLFNAALLANCEILEKHNHSSDIWGENRFIDLGRDATYVYAYKDLKIRNNSKSRLLISMEVDEKKLTLNCGFYTSEERIQHIEVSSKIVKKLEPENIDPEKTVKKKINGWVVETIRHEISGDKKIENFRKLETYKPVIEYH